MGIKEAIHRQDGTDPQIYSNFTTVLRYLPRCRHDTSPLLTRRNMQPFEYRSVRYWSKEINGTLTGGRKKYFF